MKFNFQRVKPPAYITSAALLVIGVLFALGSMAVAAWIFLLLGLVLNVMAVSVTEISREPRVSRSRTLAVDTASRVVIEPEPDTEEQATVPVAAAKGGSHAVKAPR